MARKTKRLPVFYSGLYRRRTVSSGNPVLRSADEAAELVNGMYRCGAIVGVCLEAGLTLQFIENEHVLWGEEVFAGDRFSNGCELTIPLAEIAVRAAYEGIRMQEALKGYFLSWEKVGWK